MTTELDPIALRVILDHINVWNIQALAAGVPQNLTGKTMTAKIEEETLGSPIALSSPSSGLEFVNAATGQIRLTLSQAQANTLPLGSAPRLYLTIWNADNSQWGHGWASMAVSYG
jgi:hypothetical protein